MPITELAGGLAVFGVGKANQLNTDVHSLSDLCFKKCIAGRPITSSTLDRSEESCAENCVGRWMDTQINIISKLQKMGN